MLTKPQKQSHLWLEEGLGGTQDMPGMTMWGSFKGGYKGYIGFYRDIQGLGITTAKLLRSLH